jgi:hypothetical protein
MDSISRIIEQATREASSSLQSVTQLVPGGWGGAIALLLLLPTVGIFLRPILRLSGAATQSIAAIGSAVMVCVSSWVVLLIQYVTVCAHALHPSRGVLPIVRLVLAAALIVAAKRFWGIPFGFMVNVVAAGLAIYGLYYFQLWQRVIPGQGVFKQKGTQLALCGGMLLCAAWVLLHFLYRPEVDLSQCLQHGQIQQTCVDKLNATRF